jgi:hypothetical protein
MNILQGAICECDISVNVIYILIKHMKGNLTWKCLVKCFVGFYLGWGLLNSFCVIIYIYINTNLN